MSYGHFDQDGWLLGVFEAPDDSLALEELPGWSGWPAPAAAGQRLRKVNGELLWQEPRSLDQVRADRWVAIQQERATREAGTFAVGGRVYQVDQVRLVGTAVDAMIAQQLGEEYSQAWVLADNSVALLSAAEVIAAARACKAFVSGLWVIGEGLRAQIYDPDLTAEQVNAIRWPD